jgi:type I restriction enzyme R subunit
MVQKFEPISISNESTVVAELNDFDRKETAYQSESALEKQFIELLQDQAYDHLSINSEAELISNLRLKLEELNKIQFSESEWESFFSSCIASENDSVLDKTKRIQEDHIQVLKRDNGDIKNIYLIDKQNIHNNSLQVLNQYEIEGARKNRYDVTILVNGLPLVHVELKRRGVDIREAFNQINRYQRDSFWAGSGLFEYIQIFVISNGTYTKYYSNTVRSQHIQEDSGFTKVKKTSNSYEFTSWWADANNKAIYDLIAFGKTFFAKHSILNVLTKYCVFTTDPMLLVMRPYQIVATEKILQKIVISENQKVLGSIQAGGYIWHTTGSGKTLTSFKTAQLASKLPTVDKVLFVVDRKDLDYQTMKEYDRFEKGAANSNVSTSILKKQLEDPDARIIITTIQKLDKFVKQNEKHSITKKRVILIFDECHRSQFGDMHTAIKKAFSNYNLFGFTGTPIFAINSSSGNNPQLRTTEQAFGVKLHTYTIVDAITDKNVLPFRVDYVNTLKLPEEIKDKQISAIDKESALLAQPRLEKIASYILEHFDQKTRRNESYKLKDRRVSGFNSILATASIEAAKKYYATFKELQKDLPTDKKLKIGIIYSFAPNEADADGLLPEEGFETSDLDVSSRDFLDEAIKDYNEIYQTTWSTSADKFESYYKDLALKLENRQIDLVIVVNMFLTGFDATTLNTLWVDKNLRLHGLLQAFSRTNRILNSVKTYGNIVCFRDLEENTKESISIFGNKDAGGIVLLKPYSVYFDEYTTLVNLLKSKFSPRQIPAGETDKKEFISLYNQILRLRNILSSFDDFQGHALITDADFQDYQSTYIELYNEQKKLVESDRESIIEDLVFEIELVKQIEINVDFILMLVGDLVKSTGNKNKEIQAKIERTINSSYVLRSKKDLILQFIESVNNNTNIDEHWKIFIDEQKAIELDEIITQEKLNPQKTRELISNSLSDGELKTTGTAISALLPAQDLFDENNLRGIQKLRVIEKLKAFFERFANL